MRELSVGFRVQGVGCRIYLRGVSFYATSGKSRELSDITCVAVKFDGMVDTVASIKVARHIPVP
jgi:hypothetical protein